MSNYVNKVNSDGSVYLIADEEARTAINSMKESIINKVDKEAGKGLSTNDLTNELKTSYNAAVEHSESEHARVDATAVKKSSTNGNIIINDVETTVYKHPEGTNPHGTTKSDIGLGNVGNFKAVSTEENQGLTHVEKENARNNIGAGTSSFTGIYSDLTGKPESLPASDVSAWAKAPTKPTYTASEVGLGNVGNFKSVSVEGEQNLSDEEKTNARTNIGAQVAGSYAESEHTHTKSQITDFPTLGTASAKDVASSGNASATQVVMGNDSRLTDAREASDVSAWAKAATKPTYTASEVGAIAATLKGTANGVAELDSTGKVPSSQLPSYVDDVIEGYYYNSKFYKESAHTTEITGETGKIYIDLSSEKTYRWTGSTFGVISETLALGETSSTAYRGDRGKAAYDHSQTAHAPADAEKNQNAFSNVVVGSTTVAADSATDTLTIVAGANVTITPDATNDKITIAATDTVYTHPSTHAASMITGLSTVATSGNYSDLSGTPTIPTKTSQLTNDSGFKTTDNNTTYSLSKTGSTITLTGSDGTTTTVTDDNTTYDPATTSSAGLMSASDKSKLDGIASGANNYTHPNSGVSAGTYRSVTVNAAGHVTAGTNPTVTVAQGGTGATTAAAARTNLGLANTITIEYAGEDTAYNVTL